jgi:transcriptional regulator with PAS, ATPase and Fis domain
MPSALLSWAATEDIRASTGSDPDDLGPTLRAAQDDPPDRVILLCNTGRPAMAKQLDEYASWLRERSGVEVESIDVHLTDPSDHVQVLDAATRVVEGLQKEDRELELRFLLSAGTPAMHAVWLLLAHSRFHAHLVKCSIERGTETVQLPFEISTDFAVDLLRHSDERRVRLTQGLPPDAPEFERIIAGSRPMKEAIAMARRLAGRNVPVLVLGESGTGKELFARAIHKASRRSDGPFLALNCGAISPELVDARLFGHVEGAFTGAIKDVKGVFENAEGGTLFLDEIGELPLEAQVRLLRALQEGEVVRVGDTEPRKADVRVLAATHVDLFQAVEDGAFRRDLLYRLAVGIVRLPALRERGRDIHALIDSLLDELRAELFLEPDAEPVELTAGARSALAGHRWPGNVRELRTTLARACLTCAGGKIDLSDVQDALLPVPRGAANDLLDRSLGNGFSVREVERELRVRYVERALEESGGVQSKAAKLLGLPAQTFSNWMKDDVRRDPGDSDKRRD